MIQTSHFENWGRVKNPIAISQSTPDYYSGPTRKDLAPSWELITGVKEGTITEESFKNKYLQGLNQTQEKVINSLPTDCTLLCWEKPGEFCHRHILREWLQRVSPDIKEFEVEVVKERKGLKISVPGHGIKTSPLIIVGEQPSHEEMRTKIPFMGQTGYIMNQMLQKSGLNRRDCYLTNAIKTDRPHSLYYTAPTKGSPPMLTPLGREMRSHLIKELQDCTGTVVPMGNVALFFLTEKWGIDKWRSSHLRSHLISNKIVPTIHPSTIRRGEYKNRYVIPFDLKKALEWQENRFQEANRDLIINPTYFEVIEFLNLLKFSTEIATDIEVVGSGHNLQVSCISLGVRSSQIQKYDSQLIKKNDPDRQVVMCIPFLIRKNHWHPVAKKYTTITTEAFTVEQEHTIWNLIKENLEEKTILGQNLGFDASFLKRRYGITIKKVRDTMTAQHMVMPSFRKGLGTICSFWTSINYYKDDGKDFLPGSAWEQFWQYNCLDSAACIEAHPPMLEQIKEMGNEEIYKDQCKLIPVLVEMMVEGVCVDRKAFDQAKKNLQEELNNHTENWHQTIKDLATTKYAGTLWETTSKEKTISPTSPTQLLNYFKMINAPLYKGKGKGYTTDDTAIKRYIRKGYTEALIISKIRKTSKLISTYLNEDKISPDGKIRASFNPVGTAFSRLSSSSNIFGEGMNLQNWPHSMLKFLTPDPDHVCYIIDLSQAENRIVAYLAEDKEMINAFETGKDVHSLTGASIAQAFGHDLSPEEVKSQDSAGIKCPIGNGEQTWRSVGKRSNHGLNYDLTYRAFSLDNEMPLDQARMIVEGVYHTKYCGVRNVFHAYINKELNQKRIITNLMGRTMRFFGDLKAKDRKIYRQGYNCIPQSTVGDLINKYGLNYIHYTKELKPIQLLNQVHDSVIFQIPLSADWEHHAFCLGKIKNSLEVELTTHVGIKFTIPVDITMSTTLSSKGGVEIEYNENKFESLPDLLNTSWKTLKRRSECK